MPRSAEKAHNSIMISQVYKLMGTWFVGIPINYNAFNNNVTGIVG